MSAGQGESSLQIPLNYEYYVKTRPAQRLGDD